MELPRFITVAEAETATGLPQSLLRKWLREDDPPASVRNGNQVLLEVESLSKAIKERERRCMLERK